MAIDAAAPAGHGRRGRGRFRPNGFALTWGAPLALWQGVFFLAPLVFLILMSFWIVRNYQLHADYTTKNWTEMLSENYFWKGYFRTLYYGLIAATVAVLVAFPFAYALTFKIGAGA